MNHLDEGTLQAYLDDALPSGEADAVGEHLAVCIPCRRELEQLERAWSVVGSALETVDRPEPPAADVQRAVRFRAAGMSAPPARRDRRPVLRAASIALLATAAAAAAAVPASPVRQWLETVLTEAPAPAATPVAPATPQPIEGPSTLVPAPERARPAAVAIEPRGPVRIELTDLAAESAVRVRFTDDGRARVELSDGGSHPVFRTGLSRIEMSGGAGAVEIALPTDRDASVTVNGVLVLDRVDGEVRVHRVAERQDGAIIFRFE